MEKELLEVNLYFKISLKDSIVDILLEDGYNDFFYISCAKYASNSLLKSVKEQVSGRQDYGLFQLFLDQENAQFVVNKLLQSFGKTDIRVYIHSVQSIL